VLFALAQLTAWTLSTCVVCISPADCLDSAETVLSARLCQAKLPGSSGGQSETKMKIKSLKGCLTRFDKVRKQNQSVGFILKMARWRSLKILLCRHFVRLRKPFSTKEYKKGVVFCFCWHLLKIILALNYKSTSN
jgi:hypothetical protein